MATPSSPAAESDFKRAWTTLVSGIKGGEAALGKRLYLLGAGPVPVDGATGGALTLDASGGVVLVVGVESPGEEAGAQIARQLSAIAGLPGTKLREAGIDPSEGGGLAARHAAFFDLGSPVDLNTGQRCIVVLGAAADAEAREALDAGLGAALAGVFVATEEGVTAAGEAPAGAPDAEIVLEPEAPQAEEAAEEAEPEPEAPTEGEAPAEEQAEPEAEAPVEEDVDLDVPRHEAEEPEPEGPAEIEVALDAPEATEERATVVVVDEAVEEAPPDVVDTYLEDESTTVIAEEADEAVERTGVSAWPIGNWVGLTLILAGIGLGIAGAITWGKGDDVPRGAVSRNEQIRTVVTGVTPDATHARWIGQQRVVTLTDGTIVFVYPTESSVNFVRDGADSGDTWEEPFVVEDVVGAESLSVDVDSKDRLHVAYSDGASINYVRLKTKPTGWKPSRLIQIDDDTTSLHVDVAWDEQNQTAHVVWVQQTDEGEAPAWAALTNDDGIHLTEQGSLAQAGTEVPVMVNIAADGRSSLLITYRGGDQTAGWSSRYSPGRSTDGTWLFNEEERIATSSFIGAADVLYDRQKTAHLVLRDDDARTLVYFEKTGAEPWSEGEIAYRSDSVTDETSTDNETPSLPDFPTLSYNTGEGNLYLFFQTEEVAPAGEIGYVVHAIGGTGWQGTFDIVLDGDAPDGALYPVAPDRTSVQTIVFWTRTGETYQVDSAPVLAP